MPILIFAVWTLLAIIFNVVFGLMRLCGSPTTARIPWALVFLPWIAIALIAAGITILWELAHLLPK